MYTLCIFSYNLTNTHIIAFLDSGVSKAHYAIDIYKETKTIYCKRLVYELQRVTKVRLGSYRGSRNVLGDSREVAFKRNISNSIKLALSIVYLDSYHGYCCMNVGHNL
uniref:Uncharacterized protein n=1 Tax=Lactuca sativa TaxID=4236 RepID=A0A9R1V482_LACSA|nr:hypothetical protein LSAT_V11C600300740 [Lactuca sativa]